MVEIVMLYIYLLELYIFPRYNNIWYFINPGYNNHSMHKPDHSPSYPSPSLT